MLTKLFMQSYISVVRIVQFKSESSTMPNPHVRASARALPKSKKLSPAYLAPLSQPWPKGELSFTRTRAPSQTSRVAGRMPRDFWVVAETGDWAADNKIGEGLAQELFQVMRDSRDPNLLGLCVKDMILHGRFGGIEFGFLFAFSSWAMRTTS
jgi:hypothetical protein